MKTALVLGAGGFIGSHMVRRLKSEGYWIRGVDVKYPEFSSSEADEFLIYDLCNPRNVEAVMRNASKFSYLPQAFEEAIPFDEVYQFAALMGGAGFIFTGEHDAEVMHDSALININVSNYAIIHSIGKLFFSSSACMYPQELQNDSDAPYYVQGLKESDAYPGNPDSEYGWEKLFSERLYLAFARNYGLNIRIARFHNIYGPQGTYKGGKEKAPAAICRKVIECKTLPTLEGGGTCPNKIEIWGDGEQTRSFLYIDDCIDAVRLLMQSDFKEPINIGSEEMVTINKLAEMAREISGKTIYIKHIEGPQGVRGRNSDNTLIRKVLGWEPKVLLQDGIKLTYNWIDSQI